MLTFGHGSEKLAHLGCSESRVKAMETTRLLGWQGGSSNKGYLSWAAVIIRNKVFWGLHGGPPVWKITSTSFHAKNHTPKIPTPLPASFPRRRLKVFEHLGLRVASGRRNTAQRRVPNFLTLNIQIPSLCVCHYAKGK